MRPRGCHAPGTSPVPFPTHDGFFKTEKTVLQYHAYYATGHAGCRPDTYKYADNLGQAKIRGGGIFINPNIASMGGHKPRFLRGRRGGYPDGSTIIPIRNTNKLDYYCIIVGVRNNKKLGGAGIGATCMPLVLEQGIRGKSSSIWVGVVLRCGAPIFHFSFGKVCSSAFFLRTKRSPVDTQGRPTSPCKQAIPGRHPRPPLLPL